LNPATLQSPPLRITISAAPKASFCFFQLPLVCAKVTFQKENLAKSHLLNASETHEKFLFEPMCY
jgi:hypothetical protein